MLTRYRITTGLLAVLIVAGAISSISALLFPNPQPIYAAVVSLLGTLAFAGLLVAHLQHRRWSESALLTVLTITCLLALEPSFLRTTVPVFVLLPVVFAGLLATPAVTLLIYAIMIIGTALRVFYAYGTINEQTAGPTFDFSNLISLTIIALGIAMISAVSRHATRVAHTKAEEAEAALRRVEQQASELTERNQQLEQRSDEQQRLLDLVAMLETPALALAEGVLFAPIVGHMDSQRAQRLTDRLLDEAHSRRARVVVIDVSGLVVMDTGVAQSLLQTARALRLLGCQVILSGISASIAITLTQLGIELSGVQTSRTPQEALQTAVRLQESASAGLAPRLARNGR